MKRLLSALALVAFAATTSAVIAQDRDEAVGVAPNTTRTITPSPAAAPARSEDEAMGVAPNTQRAVTSGGIYEWEIDYSN